MGPAALRRRTGDVYVVFCLKFLRNPRYFITSGYVAGLLFGESYDG